MSFQLKRLKKKAMIFFSCAVNSMVFTSVRFYEFFLFTLASLQWGGIAFVLFWNPQREHKHSRFFRFHLAGLIWSMRWAAHLSTQSASSVSVTDWGGRLLQQNKISERVTGHTEAPFFFYYLRVRSFTMKPSNSRPSGGGKNPFVHELKLTMTEKMKVRQ